MALNDLDVQLTEDVLNQLEIEDVLSNELCQLSINAIAGTTAGDCMMVRTLVQNKVMLILIDSGSSHSFVNARMADTLGLTLTPTVPQCVKVANGEQLITESVIHNMEWWAQGHTYSWDMKVIQMGAYDAILGYDWLRAHSPMIYDWEARTISFQDNGSQVQLTGTYPKQQALMALSAEQLQKWYLSNEIWALAVVKLSFEETTPSSVQ